MRLVTFHADDELRPGVLVDDQVIDVRQLVPGDDRRFDSVRHILDAGAEAIDLLAKALTGATARDGARPLDQVRLAAPITDPGKIICIGLNYKAHAEESGREIPEYPTIFAKWANSVTGPYDAIPVPPIENPQMDYEGELGVVVGRRASRVSAAEALDYVAGLTVVNDLTSRRLQYETTQWSLGKAIDKFAPMGPALVTLDEIADVQALQVTTRVNGEVRQSANTSTMMWPVATLVEIITNTIELLPGDIIATGTPAGIGAKRNPPVYLGPNDVVEVEIDSLGSVRNTIGE
ncbi:fumarylacetoacetate hydrolase family protein [Mycobacterium sp. ITM-2016-00317]|uniref:fumarylacetoacetate hydrolase family protein n=1 Tax=Mycobacterium sp. ITM-2016-00317 TaxID=2099694 RepID=UPI00287FE68C|nr:fumarylacetoacetate hydrolase family protein [Mycobacterium sp. ITM-2016-00317]WNG87529.1 fumarylacetoacetate hydrolase family protein [Mycobacterium sp. ITM-2016-00317]